MADATATDDNDVAMNNTQNQNTEQTTLPNQTDDQPQSTVSTQEPEEKKQDNTSTSTTTTTTATTAVDINNANFGKSPLTLIQSTMHNFLHQMSSADSTATELYQTYLLQQQALMNQFVSDSLKLMHGFNTSLQPIHAVLKQLKAPLCDILLNQYIAIPCDRLDEITQKQMTTRHNKSWGVSPLTHQYNQKQMRENPHLQRIDLGPEVESFKASVVDSIQPPNNNNSTPQAQAADDPDSQMTENVYTNQDKTTSQTSQAATFASELVHDRVLQYLSNTGNITASQVDLVLKFFNSSRQQQQRLEIKQQEKLKKAQEQLQQQMQREAGAQMLLSFFPWLALEQAVAVMEMKSDIIEQATDYCMNTDPADLFLAVNAWKSAHPTSTKDVVMSDLPPLRSSVDQRVFNRQQSTGELNYVTFRCTDVSDDGLITLQGVLDRNNIPLDPQHAKLLHLSVADFMQCPEITMEAPERVQIAQNERVLRIVFQIVSDPESPMAMHEYQLYGDQSIQSRRQRQKQSEFVAIQFEPRCRDLEYEPKFEDKTPPTNACLTAVTHRMDGPVLFRGIYNEGKSLGLIGSSMDNPIEIYSQIVDDVTHNIVCIIFENDLRDNIVVDVKNLSFTGQSLDDVIADSTADFDKTDAANNKISYRVVVKDKRVIGVLTKFGNEIKSMAFIEHLWLSEGALVKIPSRNMLGVIKSIPTGLIVTNDPHKNVEKKNISYTKNVNSRIARKHAADLDGFLDIDVVRENADHWRAMDDPLCQAFAVTDLRECDDDDITLFFAFKHQNQSSLTDDINALIKSVESDFSAIKNAKNGGNDSNSNMSPADLLNRATNTVKKVQESLASFKSTKSQLTDKDSTFIQHVNEQISKYNREIRTLRFETMMK